MSLGSVTGVAFSSRSGTTICSPTSSALLIVATSPMALRSTPTLFRPTNTSVVRATPSIVTSSWFSLAHIISMKSSAPLIPRHMSLTRSCPMASDSMA